MNSFCAGNFHMVQIAIKPIQIVYLLWQRNVAPSHCHNKPLSYAVLDYNLN